MTGVDWASKINNTGQIWFANVVVSFLLASVACFTGLVYWEDTPVKGVRNIGRERLRVIYAIETY